MIGALAGGPIGAAIGAGAGAGAGVAGAAITGRKQVRLPAETEFGVTGVPLNSTTAPTPNPDPAMVNDAGAEPADTAPGEMPVITGPLIT